MRTANRSILNDPFDGRFARQQQFVARLTGRAPEIRNLNPILDELRSLKSAREIALVRKASELAGLGMMEAIRSTEPGVKEYQLEAAARYVFIVNGARLDGYRSITAAGNVNINNMHYFRNADALKDGDWVLMDYAPDFRYYVSDIGRMWPVNGTFAPWQRELLQFVLDYRNAVMTRIRPGVTTTAIRDEADHGDGGGLRAHEVLQARVRTGGAHARRPAAACFPTVSALRCTTSAAIRAAR